MEYITLGYILKPFGLKGEVRCKSLTSFARMRFKKGTNLSLHNEKTDERKEVTVKSFRDSGDYYFLSFNECTDINAVEVYNGFAIEMDKEKATLPKGYYHFQDLMGCKVIDFDNKERVIGTVIDVLDYSTTKTLLIKDQNDKNIYVPFKQGLFVKNIDLENKIIEIFVMEGLL